MFVGTVDMQDTLYSAVFLCSLLCVSNLQQGEQSTSCCYSKEKMVSNGFLFAVIHLSALVSGHVCVEQLPSIVHLTEGKNVTISCYIHADEGEKISKFLVEWFKEEAEGQLINVGKLSKLKGRLHENTNSIQHSASLSFYMLELNDTGRYFCNFIYRIDHHILQLHANGTRLIVQEEVTADTTIASTTENTPNNTSADTEKVITDNLLLTFLLSLPLLLKFVATVFICVYTLFSYTSIVISCRFT
ncbi:uncharacterized protein LOC124394631 isoform X2 [Silurus meridionalis]|uniref:uncharacterized protein LOC124394631 isoform X2 n=1 Tax=Silurus meridionalis TaxID=175797 RepID=UPI001EEA03B5|nr:uncharacterized protein LOC124394631 isoform X2 [Silurus meridionalis]